MANKITREFAFNITANAGQAMSVLGGVLNKLSAVQQALGILTAPIKGFVNTWVQSFKDMFMYSMQIKATFDMLRGMSSEVVGIASRFESINASLATALKSNAFAEMQFQKIRTFAAKTPFQVDEIADAFKRLANRGIVPTMQQLTKMGDLAASQGKGFVQLSEAILDAQVFENERLKEFGIRASINGNKVQYSFKGIRMEFEKNSKAITEFIDKVGGMKGVTGGMEKQSQTLGGTISNLKDSYDELLYTVGMALKPVFIEVLNILQDMIKWTTNNARVLREWGEYFASWVRWGVEHKNLLMGIFKIYSFFYAGLAVMLPALKLMFISFLFKGLIGHSPMGIMLNGIGWALKNLAYGLQYVLPTALRIGGTALKGFAGIMTFLLDKLGLESYGFVDIIKPGTSKEIKDRLGKVGQSFNDLGERISNGAKAASNAVSSAFGNISKNLNDAAVATGNSVNNMVKNFTGLGDSAKTVGNNIIDGIKGATSAAGNLATDVGSRMASLFGIGNKGKIGGIEAPKGATSNLMTNAKVVLPAVIDNVNDTTKSIISAVNAKNNEKIDLYGKKQSIIGNLTQVASDAVQVVNDTISNQSQKIKEKGLLNTVKESGNAALNKVKEVAIQATDVVTDVLLGTKGSKAGEQMSLFGDDKRKGGLINNIVDNTRAAAHNLGNVLSNATEGIMNTIAPKATQGKQLGLFGEEPAKKTSWFSQTISLATSSLDGLNNKLSDVGRNVTDMIQGKGGKAGGKSSLFHDILNNTRQAAVNLGETVSGVVGDVSNKVERIYNKIRGKKREVVEDFYGGGAMDFGSISSWEERTNISPKSIDATESSTAGIEANTIAEQANTIAHTENATAQNSDTTSTNANTTATTTNTTATTTNTTAENVNTTSTVAGTAAENTNTVATNNNTTAQVTNTRVKGVKLRNGTAPAIAAMMREAIAQNAVTVAEQANTTATIANTNAKKQSVFGMMREMAVEATLAAKKKANAAAQMLLDADTYKSAKTKQRELWQDRQFFRGAPFSVADNISVSRPNVPFANAPDVDRIQRNIRLTGIDETQFARSRAMAINLGQTVSNVNHTIATSASKATLSQILFNGAMFAGKSIVSGLGILVRGLWAIIAANPIGALITSLMVAITYLSIFGAEADKIAEKYKKMSQELEDASEKFKKTREASKDLWESAGSKFSYKIDWKETEKEFKARFGETMSFEEPDKKMWEVELRKAKERYNMAMEKDLTEVRKEVEVMRADFKKKAKDMEGGLAGKEGIEIPIPHPWGKDTKITMAKPAFIDIKKMTQSEYDTFEKNSMEALDLSIKLEEKAKEVKKELEKKTIETKKVFYGSKEGAPRFESTDSYNKSVVSDTKKQSVREYMKANKGFYNSFMSFFGGTDYDEMVRMIDRDEITINRVLQLMAEKRKSIKEDMAKVEIVPDDKGKGKKKVSPFTSVVEDIKSGFKDTYTEITDTFKDYEDAVRKLQDWRAKMVTELNHLIAVRDYQFDSELTEHQKDVLNNADKERIQWLEFSIAKDEEYTNLKKKKAELRQKTVEEASQEYAKMWENLKKQKENLKKIEKSGADTPEEAAERAKALKKQKEEIEEQLNGMQNLQIRRRANLNLIEMHYQTQLELWQKQKDEEALKKQIDMYNERIKMAAKFNKELFDQNKKHDLDTIAFKRAQERKAIEYRDWWFKVNGVGPKKDIFGLSISVPRQLIKFDYETQQLEIAREYNEAKEKLRKDFKAESSQIEEIIKNYEKRKEEGEFLKQEFGDSYKVKDPTAEENKKYEEALEERTIMKEQFNKKNENLDKEKEQKDEDNKRKKNEALSADTRKMIKDYSNWGKEQVFKVMDVFTAISEAQVRMLDKQIAAIEKWRDTMKDALRQGGEEARNYTAEQLAREDDRANKLKKLRADEINKQRAFTEAKAFLDMVVAITGILASGINTASGGIAGPFLVAATLAQFVLARAQAKAQAEASVAEFAEGGLLDGAPHSRGGIKTNLRTVGGKSVELEGGEFVVNKKSAMANLPLLRAINDGNMFMENRFIEEQKRSMSFASYFDNEYEKETITVLKDINKNIKGQKTTVVVENKVKR